MTEDLTRTLRERADDVHGRPLTLDDVRGRARSIRRRRAAGVVAAVAAVAVIATPVALLSGRDDSRLPQPAPSPTRAVDPHDGDVLFLHDGVLTYPDGPWLPLPGDLRETATSFAALGTDRFVVLSPDGNRQQGTLIDDHGSVLARFPLYSGITVAPDGRGITWVEPDRSLHLLVAGRDQPRTIPVDGLRPTQTSAISGDCTDLCTISVQLAEGGVLGETRWVSSDGTVTDGPSGVAAVLDFAPDGSLFAGAASVADDGIHFCGGVYGGESGERLWGGCRADTYQFSPDGAYVATTSDNGERVDRVDILDAQTGTEIYRSSDGDWVPSVAWEDADHLLVVHVADDGSTSLERVGVHRGSGTVLDGLTSDMDPPMPAIMLPSQG